MQPTILINLSSFIENDTKAQSGTSFNSAYIKNRWVLEHCSRTIFYLETIRGKMCRAGIFLFEWHFFLNSSDSDIGRIPIFSPIFLLHRFESNVSGYAYKFNLDNLYMKQSMTCPVFKESSTPNFSESIRLFLLLQT